MLPKMQAAFLLEHKLTLLDGWIGNSRKISICSNALVANDFKYQEEHKCPTFSSKSLQAKSNLCNASANTFSNADAGVMIPMPRFSNGNFIAVLST